MKKITWFVLFFLVFMAKEGKAQLLTQNFDTALTWTVGHPTGTSDNLGWSRVTEGYNPSTTPFAGEGMAMLNTYGIITGNSYDLNSPSIAFAGGSYRVSFKMYRDSGYAGALDNIEVYYNTSPTSAGGVLLGKVHRSIESTPTVTESGWYTYNFNIPGNPNGTGYISLLGNSFWGNNIFIDNIAVELQPTCLAPTDLTATIASNSATISFAASLSSPANGYQYELRTSGEPGSGTTGLVASGTQAGLSTSLNSLVPNTLYVFYVKAICSLTDSSSWEGKNFKTLPSPPVNDTCTGATTLVVNNDLNCTNITSGTLLGATASGESTPTTIGVPDDDVWYKFTATSTFLKFTLSDIQESATGLVTEILGGNCGGALYNIAISDADSFRVSDLTIGEVYYLRVFSRTEAANPTTTFKICISTLPAFPANDNCSTATLLTPSANTTCANGVSGSTISATQSIEGCQGNADDDVWYKFVATATLHSVMISDIIGSTNIIVEAFDACNGTSIKCQYYSSDLVALGDLTVGNTYYFRIYTYDIDLGASFTVCVVTPPAPPANDSPSNASVLIASSNSYCSNALAGTTISASHSAQYTCDTYSKDVWYTFIPAASGTYYLTSNLTSTSFSESFVSIYSGTPGSLIQLNTSCYTSSINEALVAGTTYYISVASPSAEGINFSLCAFLQPNAPANDQIANADVLTASPDSSTCTNAVSGTTLLATHSSDYLCDTYAIDVWYTFTPATTGEYNFKRSVISGSGDGFLSIYSGTAGNLTRLNPFCYSPTILGQVLTAGITYYVSVSSSSSSYLSFALCASLAPPAPANDECENAITLTPSGTFAQSAIVATNGSATRNPSSPDPESVIYPCDAFNYSTSGRDVWFKVIAPASGTLTIETGTNNDQSLQNTALYAYRGTSCTALTYINCSGDIGRGNNFSRVYLSDLTPGETITARVWGYNGTQGSFKIGAYDASLATPSFDNNSFKAYPNPVKDILNLSYSQEMTNVSIFNLLGQQVIDKTLNDSKAQVDMSGLSKGIYLVKVTVDNQVKTIKVIKE
ncbi:T9SS type A sorting domain-containing protein [uncultured Flavobacterium sp.]|uniref:T9SS type A sorting domain-containing protein n=1 Tax=uncultured Flavobacterium sp. TaxID=165435 RepID=UPI0025D87C25|nr:T9SS type A sorting domain-containing protein [uncultured Flavobacterium sp.]